MFSATKVKCPKCGRQVLKKVMAVTSGRCNNCGYRIAGAITRFLPQTKTTMDIINELSV